MFNTARPNRPPNVLNNLFAPGSLSEWVSALESPNSFLIRYPLPGASFTSGKYAKWPERVAEIAKIVRSGHPDPHGEILRVLDRPTRYDVTGWTSGSALSNFNQHLYSAPGSFAKENGSPDLFVNPVFGKALGRFLGHISRNHFSEELRIIEFSHGAQASRWPAVVRALPRDRKHKVLLTDFSTSALPEIATLPVVDHVRFHRTAYDLTTSPRVVSPSKRWDVGIMTYAVDSIFLAGNATYASPEEGVYLQGRCRMVSVPGKDGIFRPFLEHDYRPVTLESEPYGLRIKDELDKCTPTMAVFPLGVARKIEELFNRVLSRDAVLVIGEIAFMGSPGQKANVQQYCSAGMGAQYQIQNFPLLIDLLRDKGFQAQSVPFREFVNAWADKKLHSADYPDQWILTVKRA